MSYWVANISKCSGFGAENGLCVKVQSPLSVFSKNGKSTPQQNASKFGLFLSSLKSGLSELYFSIASLWVRTGKGICWIFFCGYRFLIVVISISSIIFITSFCSEKLISKSSWVNSGCLSPLVSSSLKHLAIWKYFSIPAAINNCLYCWGDCGRDR